LCDTPGDYQAAFELACIALKEDLAGKNTQPCFLKSSAQSQQESDASFVWYQGHMVPESAIFTGAAASTSRHMIPFHHQRAGVISMQDGETKIENAAEHEDDDLVRNWRQPKGVQDHAAQAGQAERRCFEALNGAILIKGQPVGLNNGIYDEIRGMVGQDTLEVLGVKKYHELFGQHGLIVDDALAQLEQAYATNSMHDAANRIQRACEELRQAAQSRKQDMARYTVTCKRACDASKCKTCAHAFQMRQVDECLEALQVLLTDDVGKRLELLEGTRTWASAKGYGDWRDSSSVCNTWKWSALAGQAERGALQALGFTVVMGTPLRPMCVGNGVHRNGWLTNSALDAIDPGGAVDVRSPRRRRQYFDVLWGSNGLVASTAANIHDAEALHKAIERLNVSEKERTPPCGFHCGKCTHCSASGHHKMQLTLIVKCRDALCHLRQALEQPQPM
jgi:hypothetical protein